MYFWNIDKLKQDIKDGGLSESEQFKYLLVFIVLMTLSEIVYVGESFSSVKYDLAIDIIFAIFGTYYLYRCNGGANGKRFLEKFFSIGFVVGVRWIVFIILPIAFVLFFDAVFMIFNMEDEKIFDILDYIIIPIAMLIYYWRSGVQIKDVAK